MIVFDEIEKLITEHGSTSIPRDHVSSLREQVATLERRIVELTVQNEVLVVENRRIGLIQDKTEDLERKIMLLGTENNLLRKKENKYKAKSDDLIMENHDLQKKLKSFEQPVHESPLDETEIKILMCLGNCEAVKSSEISAALNISKPIIDFHIDVLKTKDFIRAEYMFTIGDLWYLEQKGRKYLIENRNHLAASF